jgi:hypothetical protein
MTEFNKYFEENFIVEEGYNGKEIDKDFRFDENNRHATPRDVFDVIKKAFENGEEMDKVEAFIRKLDMVGKDKVDNIFNFRWGSYYENLPSSSFEINGRTIEVPHYVADTGKLRTDTLQELCDKGNVPSKINFKNVVFIINNKTFEELHEIMNATVPNFRGLRGQNFYKESGMEASHKEDEAARKREVLEIVTPTKHDMGNGRYYINASWRDEILEKTMIYGPGKVIGAGVTVAEEFVKSIVQGNLIIGAVGLAFKLRKKSKIRKMTDGKDHFDYETFKRMMEKGYYNTNLDEMKQTDIERKEFKMEQLNEILNQIYR